MENRRKGKLRLFISAIVILIAGVALLGGALLADGLNRDAWVNANARLRKGQGLYEEPKMISLTYDDIGGFSSIDFDIASHGVILEKGEAFGLSYAEDFEGEFTAPSVTDGRLTLKQNNTNPQGKSFFKYFQTNMDWVIGFWDGWEDLYKVRLTVPADFAFDKIKINCTSGSVRLEGINAGEADIRATSGYVSLEDMEVAGKLDLYLTSGSLYLNDVKAEDIAATLTSGSAHFDKVTAGRIKALLTSGAARFNLVAAENIEMRLTSGSFHLDGVTADEMRAELTSGGLKVNSSDIKASYIDLSSGSAAFSGLPGGFTSAATAFSVKVTSGSLKIDGVKRESPYVSSPEGAAYKIEGKLTSGSFKFN